MPPTEMLPGPVQGESTGLPLTGQLTGPSPGVNSFPYPPDDLLIDDGVPLESNWHRLQINFLIDMITWHRRDHRDYFAGGNMFLYYGREQARNLDFRGPDFFLVNNVRWSQDRPYWAIWDEGGRYPDLIIELLSPSTRDEDLTTKYRLYEQTFATAEYVAYDPDSQKIHAWRKIDRVFEPIPADSNGRFPLATAELKIGKWVGRRNEFETTWLRFFDDRGEIVRIGEEAEGLRADAANARADAADARASEADARADAEKARADALASELARLKAQLPHA